MNIGKFMTSILMVICVLIFLSSIVMIMVLKNNGDLYGGTKYGKCYDKYSNEIIGTKCKLEKNLTLKGEFYDNLLIIAGSYFILLAFAWRFFNLSDFSTNFFGFEYGGKE